VFAVSAIDWPGSSTSADGAREDSSRIGDAVARDDDSSGAVVVATIGVAAEAT
jgi:hypothetical protein